MSKKSSISRRQFLNLTGTLAAGAVVAACTPQATPVAPETAPTTVPATSAPTTVPATAAPTALPEYEIVYMYPGTVQKDMDLVSAELSKITKAKFNATVKLVGTDWGAFDEKMKLANAAKEKVDLEFTAPWINNYSNNVSNGSLIPLDDLLQQYAPMTWASMKPGVWNAARVNGKIYGIINQQQFFKNWGIATLKKDLADKYKITLDNVAKLEDVTAILKTLKDGEGFPPLQSNSDPNSSGVITWAAEYYGFDPVIEIVGNCTLVGVKYDDKTRTAINITETTEFKKAVELVRSWRQAGYISEPKPQTENLAVQQAGTGGVIAIHVVSPKSNSETKSRVGWDSISKGLSPLFLTTAGVIATMNGISSACKDPARTMQFVELLNSDPAFFNLITNGIEGKHWVWVDKSKNEVGYPEGLKPDTDPYHTGTGWMFGCAFKESYWDQDSADSKMWDATAAINAQCEPSAVLGFSFVQEPVKTEMSQITNVVNEQYIPLTQGLADPDTALPKLQSSLKDAGLDKVIAEVQKQINDWVKANGLS
jgi:putative aldouronate transport system substrate-binding protein